MTRYGKASSSIETTMIFYLTYSKWIGVNTEHIEEERKRNLYCLIYLILISIFYFVGSRSSCEFQTSHFKADQVLLHSIPTFFCSTFPLGFVFKVFATADFIIKVLSVYTHSMTTIYLCLTTQVVKITFFMKSLVLYVTFHNF